MQKDYTRAIENYQKSIKQLKTYPVAHFNIGNAYRASDKLDLARRSYTIALKYEKDKIVLSKIHFAIGLIYNEQKNLCYFSGNNGSHNNLFCLC